jgi:hypothetical protein
VTIHLLRCDTTERIFEARLAQLGRDQIPDNGDDVIIWKAQSSSGVLADAVVVGQPPEGLMETLPLTQPLQPAAEYYVLVDSGVTGIAHFRPAQLREDAVVYEDETMPAAKFQELARSGGKCARPYPIWVQILRFLILTAVVGLVAGGVVLIARRRRGVTVPGQPPAPPAG